jgi:uncharacterized protein (DUF1330 family)
VAAYLICDIRIINQTRYEEYRAMVREAIIAHEGRYLVRGNEVEVLEGVWAPPRIVMIAFPDRERCRAFYHSPAYERARAVRANATMIDMIMVEGVRPEPAPRDAAAAPATAPTYVIADIKVINPERYAAYASFVKAGMRLQGGRYLVRDGAVEVLEGIWQPEHLSVIEYPDHAAARARIDSVEYAESRQLSTNAAMFDIVMVEGVVPGAPL